MNETDVIRRYCLKQGYSEKIAEMDLEAQVSRWEKTVKFFIESDYPKRFYIYDYLNDMDGRRILDECLALFPEPKKKVLTQRVGIADDLLKTITQPTRSCIWGGENAQKCGYERHTHWYYFRRPKDADSSWDQMYRPQSLGQ